MTYIKPDKFIENIIKQEISDSYLQTVATTSNCKKTEFPEFKLSFRQKLRITRSFQWNFDNRFTKRARHRRSRMIEDSDIFHAQMKKLIKLNRISSLIERRDEVINDKLKALEREHVESESIEYSLLLFAKS